MDTNPGGLCPLFPRNNLLFYPHTLTNPHTQKNILSPTMYISLLPTLYFPFRFFVFFPPFSTVFSRGPFTILFTPRRSLRQGKTFHKGIPDQTGPGDLSEALAREGSQPYVLSVPRRLMLPFTIRLRAARECRQASLLIFAQCFHSGGLGHAKSSQVLVM